ncbi:MAG: glycerol-3-phosphate 1-O-acyltransferase PlsY [Candidatus Latescibacterota bacterium]|nr:MAG: glycerol-3-phosphate 1-O-acyltransferase PlsY [Candidatus Latescibacterota bacterium]
MGAVFLDLAVVGAVAYIAGAIPFSFIAGKIFGGIDLREHGSGNLGASNTYRLLGGKIALAVLAGDVAKGFLPVFLATSTAPNGAVADHWLMIVAAFFAVIGHMFSVFVRFSGGKGIATAAGALLALSPLVFLASFAVFLVAFAATRIVSVGSLAGAIALPIAVLVLDKTGVARSHWSLLVVAVVIMIVIVGKHHSNIRRLIAGEEPALQRSKR